VGWTQDNLHIYSCIERFSLYYDIELFKDIGLTGGEIFPTTTIVTKKRIFIPVTDELRKFFELSKGESEKKFYARFDTI